MKKIISFAILCVTLPFIWYCGNKPLFTDLVDSSLVVVLKGTYESNTPRGWDTMSPNGNMSDDSVVLYPASSSPPDVAPTQFMFDIAEMRLEDDRGETFKFSNYRQGYTATVGGGDTADPFFNGTGITLRNDDVKEGTYLYVHIYFRKMIFNNAKQYMPTSGGWAYEKDLTTTFFEDDVNGYNFNKFQVQSYVDGLTYESGSVNRIFPLTIPIIGGLEIKRDSPVVLEIRLAVKNYIKKYEFETYDDGNWRVVHYYAPSDWVRDAQKGELYMGRNIIAVARAYVPGETGTITGTVSGNRMVIAIPANDTNPYSVTETIRSQRGVGSADCNFLPAPGLGGYTPDFYLDYYLKIEDYYEAWNQRVSGGTPCSSFTIYSNVWSAYENDVSDIIVAPLATFNNGGGFTITNVPYGSYYVYYVDYPQYGTLFSGTGISPSPFTSYPPVPYPVVP